MKCEFIGQTVEFIGGYGGADTVESAARTCTQTEVKGDSAGFVQRLIKRGHMSPTEFGYADLELEVDRGIQQELTRHRQFSYNVESTRLINYTKKPLRFVTKPSEDMDVPDVAVQMLERLCQHCADEYEAMLALGVPRDYARKCLPLATASKMRMGGNLRAWMEMLPKRLGRTAHAEVREVSRNILGILKAHFVGVFDHVEEE